MGLASIRDLIDMVKNMSYEDLEYGVKFIRTRPFSRISAITYKGCPNPEEGRYTISMILEFKEPREVYDYLVRHGVRIGKITIYRGGSPIKPGDWVAIDPSYASEYGKVYALDVTTDDVIWAGTDVKEYYYVPKSLQCRFRTPKEFWEFVHKEKPEEEIDIGEMLGKKVISAIIGTIVAVFVVKMVESLFGEKLPVPVVIGQTVQHAMTESQRH